MKIIYEQTQYHKFAIISEYSQELVTFCRWMKDEWGWKSFSFSDGKWRFSDPKIIDVIAGSYPKVEVASSVHSHIKKEELKKEEDKLIAENAEIIKSKTESDLKINGIKGELYPFQKNAIEFLINNKGRGLLALDMGLGKTACTLAYIAHTKQDKILVVCPSSVKFSWSSEVFKWIKLKSIVIDSKKLITLNDYKENNITIINYDILKKNYDLLSNVNFDCLVIDESTYIKNPRANRSKITKQIAKKINSVILLSGTPILSRPVELFTTLNILDPVVWNNYYSYVKRYCNAWMSPWGMDVSGSSNIPELKEKIKGLMIRKRKEDVLTELPDKKFIDIPIELDAETQTKYKMLEDNFIDYLRDIKNKTDKEIRKTLQAQTLVKLGELRQLTSNGKISFAKEIIQNIIDSGEKVVVFSSYSAPLIELSNHFRKQSVIIMGSTKELDRKNAIDDFQNKKEVRIFFGGMLSANTGITLTAAANVLFLDFDWVSANMQQAWSRIDRIGQKAKSISIYQMVALNTIDNKMAKILKKKQELIDTLIEDKNIDKSKTTSVVNDLINNYEK